jgi:hypothetical protein
MDRPVSSMLLFITLFLTNRISHSAHDDRESWQDTEKRLATQAPLHDASRSLVIFHE